VRLGHAGADLLDEREHDERSDGVRDESCYDADEGCEDAEDGVEGEAGDAVGDGDGDGVQEARRIDGFAEREAAGGEDDDGPEEVVEVFFGEDAGAEEEDDGDDGYDAHVAEEAFELVADAPEDDG
jgi:hypothetical protein